MLGHREPSFACTTRFEFNLNWSWQTTQWIFISTQCRRHPFTRYVETHIPTYTSPNADPITGGYCKEYAKGKRPIGVMLDDTWFLKYVHHLHPFSFPQHTIHHPQSIHTPTHQRSPPEIQIEARPPAGEMDAAQTAVVPPVPALRMHDGALGRQRHGRAVRGRHG